MLKIYACEESLINCFHCIGKDRCSQFRYTTEMFDDFDTIESPMSLEEIYIKGDVTMAVSLKKNEAITLAKSLKKVIFSIEWQTEIDMDIHALILKDGKALVDNDFIFYGNLKHPNGCVAHSGDIRNGCLNSVGTEDETITVDLSKIPADRDEVLFTADIYNASLLGLDFTDAVGSVCKMIDADTGVVLAEYKLDRDLSGEVCCKVGRLIKHRDIWKFEALGQGVNSLAGILTAAGLAVE